MHRIKLIIAGLLVLLPFSVNATMIDIDYEYDGTTLALVSDSTELTGVSLNAGDTINLSYSAVGSNSTWDFSLINSTFRSNLGFEYPSSCGTRSSQGAYSAQLDGITVLSNTYTVAGQSCIHMGPNNIDWSGVSAIDVFAITYTMNSSTAGANIIGTYGPSNSWEIWDLFTVDAPFVSVAEVFEPGTLSLLGFGLAGIGLTRRKKA